MRAASRVAEDAELTEATEMQAHPAREKDRSSERIGFESPMQGGKQDGGATAAAALMWSGA